ncbi:hypothetical protein DV515_00017898 [Chloebia gouldiae]|uniref:PIK helical domain-containing protein n=1 Tax=Chloebia gouldiae TaxID=44316 RepID=A0A3L8Q909_CHLGU|nr:hypothetical protein DV515_00017898 [Chloebia gouldiae]
MGDSPVGTIPPEPGNSQGSGGGGGSSLSVISEGVGELALIDAEVAKKACEEVLEKVKQLRGAPDAVPNGESCPVRCLDEPPGSRIQEEEEDGPGAARTARKRQNQAKQSWLLRLFESKLFDISMAISYLYNSKEPGVQAYIGNRLFCFRDDEVDFYLPQLLNMYIHMDEDVGDAIKPYIVHRCRQSVDFSLRCALLLGAYSSDMHISTQRHSRGTKLRRLILSDELKPAGRRRELPGADTGLSPSKRTHQRSKSDATASISLSSNLKRTASNPKVESEEEEEVKAGVSPREFCGNCGAGIELQGSASNPKVESEEEVKAGYSRGNSVGIVGLGLSSKAQPHVESKEEVKAGYSRGNSVGIVGLGSIPKAQPAISGRRNSVGIVGLRLSSSSNPHVESEEKVKPGYSRGNSVWNSVLQGSVCWENPVVVPWDSSRSSSGIGVVLQG